MHHAKKPPIDAPGAFHKQNILEHLGKVLTYTRTSCYAWMPMDNHIHLLLGADILSIATVMRALLTGYA